ncbi:DUF3040 domain-containing protein [Krasilnikovia sp. MM14-A1004]|uniref:DUF3040 domain-containing protein n=1 Tax=Krasilnikovia sp. MM14-A1004 TaxID=3373541 RepID=UPI00399CA84C
MLGQDDRDKLAEIERRLAIEDPDFAARMTRPRPVGSRLHRSILLCVVSVLLWSATMVLTVGLVVYSVSPRR